MNIIHFSDIHFEINKEGSLSYEKEQLYNALVNDLKNNRYIDSNSIMVITGDLVNRGGIGFKKQNPFEKFKKLFINRIIDTAMEKLSEDDHEILYALYFRNLSLRQLSIRLKLPYTTVRYKELKALSNLKEIITIMKLSKNRLK